MATLMLPMKLYIPPPRRDIVAPVAGLHELRDEPLFRAAKTLYLQTECETAAHAR